jgi:hypothetical protein
MCTNNFLRTKAIYISGKYSGDIDTNIGKARESAIKIWEAGYTALCPHLNTYHFEQDCKCVYNDYIEGDLALLANVDGIFMLNEWEESQGAKVEHQFAIERGIPIFYNVNELNEFFIEGVRK